MLSILYCEKNWILVIGQLANSLFIEAIIIGFP